MSLLISLIVIAWIAIVLLGLAVGGLLVQVRSMEAKLAGQGVDAPSVLLRVSDGSAARLPPGAVSAVFVNSGCDTCDHVIRDLFTKVNGRPVLIVTDELPEKWKPLPPGVRAVIDPEAAERSGVPAVPWFAAVDAGGRTVESFALSNPRALKRAAQIVSKPSAVGTDRS